MSDDFIHLEYLEDVSICDEIIECYKKADTHVKGHCGKGVDPSIKDSTDICLSVDYMLTHPVMNRYLDMLEKVCETYKKKYIHCNEEMGNWRIVEQMNVQHYKPGQGFHRWHTERTGYNAKDLSRTLVYMTYLNDVNDGGETHFFYQDLKVKPRKGLTLIWPADWTHTHRGITSPTEEKYITTGWYSYTAIL